MLHQITAVESVVQKAIDSSISAFEQDTPLLQQKMKDVLNPANEAERQKFRAQILQALKAAKAGAANEAKGSTDPKYVSKLPEVGIVQAAMNATLEDTQPTAAAAPFEQFGPLDPGWLECVIDGFKTFFSGKAPFIQHQNLTDFLVAIPDRCSIVLFSDAGADNSAAKSVTRQIRALNPDICVHLGDIYYAGQDNEAEDFLDQWPLADAASGKVTRHSSFALNGNHEMFSGGRAYFSRVLFAFGQQASYFGLRNSNWQFLAFDSAYIDQRLLSPDDAKSIDERVGSQWTWLLDKIKGNSTQETILLSHHQPLSAFKQENTDGKPLNQDARKLFDAAGIQNVFAWFFGHEHQCTIYDDGATGYRARLIGNGSIPHAPSTAKQPDPGCVPFKVMNQQPNALGDAFSGFVLLKLDGPNISVQYFNEDGTLFTSETWTKTAQALAAAAAPTQ
jgi:calcineurin-like phosphoesterase family protein